MIRKHEKEEFSMPSNHELPKLAMQEIPEAKADAKSITGLTKEDGRVVGYQLSDGQIVDKAQGVQMARDGEIRNVGISSRKGNEYLKSVPDDSEDNNIGNLPAISDIGSELSDK